jgi:hypothetical protein
MLRRHFLFPYSFQVSHLPGFAKPSSRPRHPANLPRKQRAANQRKKSSNKTITTLQQEIVVSMMDKTK